MDRRLLLAEIPRLRRYAYALVGERMAADDLVQDTLERALSRFWQWRPDTELRPWLFAIMHHLRMDQLRRQRLQLVPLDEHEAELPPAAPAGDPLAQAELLAALQRLPEEQRAVLLLAGLEEMRYADIAQALGIPAGTVMSRLARGRARLRELLDGQPATPHMRIL